MTRFFSAVFSLILFAVLLRTCSAADDKELQLTLDEEFEDFNLRFWKHELTLGGGGNSEFQAYLNNRSNSFTEDGVLHIHPTFLADTLVGAGVWTPGYRYDIWGSQPGDLCTGNWFYGCERTALAGGNILNPVVSARIRTAESFTSTYGKVEVRAKLPVGDWLWPVILLQPRDNQYGNWPASGEIDIMASRGNSPDYPPGGYNQVSSTLHWGPDSTQNRYSLTHEKKNGDFVDNFHIYGLIWNESYIGTYIDSEENTMLAVNTSEMSFWEWGNFNGWENPWRGRNNIAPFDRSFYLNINLAVGGTNGYFPDLGENDTKPWTNPSPNAVNEFNDGRGDWEPTWTQDFEIDYVKVWTYEEEKDPETKTVCHPQSTSPPHPRSSQSSSLLGPGIGGGAGGALVLVLLLAAAASLLLLWIRRKRTAKVVLRQDLSDASVNKGCDGRTAGFIQGTTTSSAVHDKGTEPPHTVIKRPPKLNVAYGAVAQNEPELKTNVAYGAVAQNEPELKTNVAYTGRLEVKKNEAYTATSTGEGVGEEKYDYITENDVIITTTNEAYGTSGDVSVSSNQAYGLLQL